MKEYDKFVPTCNLRWKEEYLATGFSQRILEQAWVNMYTGEIVYRKIPVLELELP
jgi:hypothetical protein